MLQRRMLHVLLYVLFALRHPMPAHSAGLRQRWLTECRSHHRLCAQCFGTADEHERRCAALIAVLQIPHTFAAVLDLLQINERPVQWCEFDGRPAYVKLARLVPAAADDLRELLGDGTLSVRQLSDRLTQHYVTARRPDGLQIRPLASVSRFLGTFAAHLTSNSVLPRLLLNIDAERLLLAALRPYGFAVPGLLRHAGLVAVVEDAGRRLAEFYGLGFDVRALIACQMLLAGIRFTEGAEGFRFYLTDVTADNVVVHIDGPQLRVTFVDLDSVIVVDSSAFPTAAGASTVHAHEPIACYGCFAYDPETVAAHESSDFNMYAICGLLASDLYGDRSMGFLHSIPANRRDLFDALEKCVDCSNRDDCADRIIVAKYLIHLLS